MINVRYKNKEENGVGGRNYDLYKEEDLPIFHQLVLNIYPISHNEMYVTSEKNQHI